MLQNRPNPLLSLPSHLDPTRAWEHGPAVIVKEKFEAEIASAVAAAHAHIQRNGVPAGGGAGAGAGVNRVLPAGLLTLPELRDYLKIEPAERAIMLEAVGLPLSDEPELKLIGTEPTIESPIQRVGELLDQDVAATERLTHTNCRGAGKTTYSCFPRRRDRLECHPRPGRRCETRAWQADDVPAPATACRGRAREEATEVQRVYGGACTGSGLGIRDRRGQSPFTHLQPEFTSLQVLSEVLESFVDEAARGSIRVAKHRRSDKVELKDAAFFLGPYRSPLRGAQLTWRGIQIRPMESRCRVIMSSRQGGYTSRRRGNGREGGWSRRRQRGWRGGTRRRRRSRTIRWTLRCQQHSLSNGS